MPVLPKSFLEELRLKVSLTDVISKRVKLSRAGRNFTGLCPFHKEKTPSFIVNEERNSYHCFGCGAHGDAISFVMETENATFYEAVKKLAAEVGMELPKVSEEETKRDKLRFNLREVMNLACDFYAKTLRTTVGREGLEYFYSRGLSDEIINRFRLGYAPNGNELYSYLFNKQIPLADMQAAGLVRVSEKNNTPYDYFRGRIMFPIMDPSGRVIAFGGRVMKAGEEPKYLNSPDSELFNKGMGLYALNFAREEALNKKEIIASEGYMDVIALHSYGYTNAVAPLGTAITEAQIEMMWKYARLPTICLDGDGAGIRAAQRAAERVLSILKPGYSLRFAFIPDGLDPDEMLRSGNQTGFDEVLKNARSLTEVLWDKILSAYSKGELEPQEKAAIEKDIASLTAQIKDKSLANFMAQDLRDIAWKHFRKSYAPSKKTEKPVRAAAFNAENAYAAKLIALILTYPQMASAVMEDLARVTFKNSRLNSFMHAALAILAENELIDASAFAEQLKDEGMEWVFALSATERELLAKKSFGVNDFSAELAIWEKSFAIKNIQDEIASLTTQLKVNHDEELLLKRTRLQSELAELELSDTSDDVFFKS